MKKTVWSFGLISAAVSIVMMLVTLPFIEPGRYGTADVLGYTSIVLSALLVFFGIRSYRENAGGGRLSFGRGLSVGLLITLISCVCYAAAFEVVYFKVVPDFGEKFAACMVERTRASGGTPQAVAAAERQAGTLKRLYDHPATNAALSFATSFPVGLLATAVSAAILRKR
jgi:uncharacterized protein DUF4199